MQSQPFDPLSFSPIMPVVKIAHIDHAVPLASALLDGGISVIEITLRSDCALQAIEKIRKTLPDMKVGAGTITCREHLVQCVDAGAEFGLSPGATPLLLKAAQQHQWPFVPGVATASEMMSAMENGYKKLKFFPAEINGGCKALKSFSGPFPDLLFCPTGGINLNNLRDYLALENVICVGGTWLTPSELVENKHWQKITDLCKQSLAVVESYQR